MRPAPGFMQYEHHVLLVEDDEAIASALADALMSELMKVTVARSGGEAIAILRSMNLDFLILDIELPEIDGFEVLSCLRASGLTLPVMVLSARDDAATRAKSSDHGADVFLSKPIAISEFTTQVRALAERVNDKNSARLVYGPLVLDREADRAFLNGNPLDLPRREWSLLEILLSRAGKVQSKNAICRYISSGNRELSPNAVEVHISRLRTKLAPAGIQIRSVRGLGYMLPKWDPHAGDR